jgi:transcriptional regulator GlxA family with amidase domain
MDKTRYAFLTLANYSLIAVTNALEVLRMANRVVGQDVYEWSIASLDGRPVPASSTLELTPTIALDKIGKVEIPRLADQRATVSNPCRGAVPPAERRTGSARSVPAAARWHARAADHYRDDPLGELRPCARSFARAPERPGVQHRSRSPRLRAAPPPTRC